MFEFFQCGDRLSVWESFLYVKIWRLQTLDSDEWIGTALHGQKRHKGSTYIHAQLNKILTYAIKHTVYTITKFCINTHCRYENPNMYSHSFREKNDKNLSSSNYAQSYC